MFCLRITPRFHFHWHVKARRLGFVKARTPRVNDWGWMGARISLWWSSVARSRHWFMTGGKPIIETFNYSPGPLRGLRRSR